MQYRFRSLLSGIVLASFAALSTAKAEPVTLTLAGGSGTTDVTVPISWQIQPIGKSGKAESKIIAQMTAPTFTGDLKIGHYLVTARLGGTKVQKAIFVTSGENKRRIYVDQAHLTMQMIPYTGAPVVREPISWEVYTYAKGVTESGRKVAAQYAANPTFELGAGTYVVRALYKGTKSDLVVPIEAGQGLKYTINLYSGTARLKATSPDKKEGITWQIVRAQPNTKGQYQLVTEIVETNPTVTVREGNYLVIAKSKSGKYWAKAPLSIKAARSSQVELALKDNEGTAPSVISPSGTLAQNTP